MTCEKPEAGSVCTKDSTGVTVTIEGTQQPNGLSKVRKGRKRVKEEGKKAGNSSLWRSLMGSW